MPIRKPLVVIDGQVQQLPSGDTIDAPTSKWPMVCDTIAADEIVTIPEHYQLIIATQINNSGTINNDGVLYVL